MNSPCPCNSNHNYIDCCQPVVEGNSDPTNAEQLMRSRYSAFVNHNVDYLFDSLLPDKRQSDERKRIENSFKDTKWVGLKILNKTHGGQSDATGTVEFVAFYYQTGSTLVRQLHENSSFIKSDEKWFYVNGKPLPPVKLGRNELCYCGSGKKYKKCHAPN